MRYLSILYLILLTGCIKEDRLSLGKGPESILLFEEFLCPACQETVNSELQFFVKNYVDTGKGKLTIIPTAFFESSRPSFAAFHQINQYDPSLLYPFLLFIYQMPQEELRILSTKEILAKFYKNIPIDRLIQTINEDDITRSIEKNCTDLEQFYEGDMHLPTYIFKGKTIAGGNLLRILVESSP